MSRKQLNKSEIRELNSELIEYGFSFDAKDKIEIFKEDYEILMSNNTLMFFRFENRWAPTLKLILERNFLKKIVVDMGAVRFVVSGADIMRPGVVEIDEGISSGDFVAVADVNNKKPLAVGIALFSADQMRRMEKGKVIKNIHFVGDKLWNSF